MKFLVADMKTEDLYVLIHKARLAQKHRQK